MPLRSTRDAPICRVNVPASPKKVWFTGTALRKKTPALSHFYSKMVNYILYE